jgi:hypothetical protein
MKKHTLPLLLTAMLLAGGCDDKMTPEPDPIDPLPSYATANEILSFQLDITKNPAYQPGDAAEVTIVPERDSVYALVPWYVETSLAPVITLSPEASISPVSGARRDFSQGTVKYTVKAQNGDKREWRVRVEWRPEPAPPSSDNPRHPLDESDRYVIRKIPVYSNAYISGTGVSLSEANGTHNWTGSGIYSIYFIVRADGELQLALRGRSGSSGTTTNALNVKVYINGEQAEADGMRYDHTYAYGKTNMASDTITLHRVTLPGIRPGHAGNVVRIDLQAEGSRNGTYYFRFPELWVSGWATRGTDGFQHTGLNYVPLSDAYYGRRGSMAVLTPEKPSGDMEYFYSEVYIPERQDVVGTYFMCNGFNPGGTGGYAGIQVNSATERRVLFSVWSAISTDDPAQMGKYAPRLVRVNNDPEYSSLMNYTTFGNEGSGGQSYLRYPWEAGKTYKMLTRVRPHPQPEKYPYSTLHKTWFHNGERWIFLAEWRRMELDPADNGGKVTQPRWYSGAYHFIENFDVAQGDKTRYGTWNNDWYVSANGQWYETTSYVYSYSRGGNGERIDRAGGIMPAGDPQAGALFLKISGFFTDGIVDDTKQFFKPPLGLRPTIDFDALNAMGTDNPAEDSRIDPGEQYEE